MSKRKDQKELKLLVIEVGNQIVAFVDGIDPRTTLIDKDTTLEFLRNVFLKLDEIAEKIGLKDG